MNTEDANQQLQKLLSALPHPQAALAPLVGALMATERQVSDELQVMLAEECGVPLDQVRQMVAAFESCLNPEDATGVCGDVVCNLSGARDIYVFLKESSQGEIPVVLTSCLGYCHAAPVVRKPDGTYCRGTWKTGSEKL